jgi:tRNA A37 threonylcarbamoyladenosine modification protein TsaB
VPTLAAVASAVGQAMKVGALLPAGRGELFAQMFSVSVPGVVTPADEPVHIAPQRLVARYRMVDNIVWAGEGAEAHRQFIDDYAMKHALNWRFAPADRNLARQVALIGLKMYELQETIPPESLHAIYVRPSDAELKADVVNK